MQKIFISKEDSQEEIIDSIAATDDGWIMLVVPRGSKIKSVKALQSLQKEALEVEKNIMIESVDEEILASADKAGIESVHPFLNSRNSQSLADIVPTPQARVKEEAQAKKMSKGVKKTALQIDEEDVYEEEEEIPIVMENGHVRRRIPWKQAVIWTVIVFFFGSGVLMANSYFTKAEIIVDFTETPWEYSGTFTAFTSVSRSDSHGNVLAGQLLKNGKNIVQFYPATGFSEGGQKAKGKITIFNNFSAESQALVATTRFETPDGKIYRLDKAVTVPGAQKSGSQLVPTSIKADITADSAGPEFNSGAITKLTIPGFKGTDRYEGFYGAIEEGMSGGAVGEKKVPTEADAINGKNKTAEILRSAFNNTFSAKPPEGLNIIEGASEFRTVRLDADSSANEEGNFAVFGDAEFRAMAFRESDLMNILKEKIKATHESLEIKNIEISYSEVSVDFEKGELKFELIAKAELRPPFDQEEFKNRAIGMDEDEVRLMLLQYPQMKEAKVILKPSWANKLPKSVSRIDISVN